MTENRTHGLTRAEPRFSGRMTTKRRCWPVRGIPSPPSSVPHAHSHWARSLLLVQSGRCYEFPRTGGCDPVTCRLAPWPAAGCVRGRTWPRPCLSRLRSRRKGQEARGAQFPGKTGKTGGSLGVALTPSTNLLPSCRKQSLPHPQILHQH